MASGKKRKRQKIKTHKRKKKRRAMRHKKRNEYIKSSVINKHSLGYIH